MPTIEYYGLSSFAVEYENRRVLVDPWITEPDWLDAEIAEFADVETVFVTHGAHDHLGDTLPIAEVSGAEIVTEPAVATYLVERGVPKDRVHRVIWGNCYTTADLTVQALETRHLSYFEGDNQHLSGMPLGFYFEFKNAKRSLYYVGDTSLFSDLALFVEHTDPDVVMLPIGAAPGDLAPLPPRDAARAASEFDVETIIPVHYVPDSGEVAAFRREFDERVSRNEQPDVVPLAIRERFEV